MLGDQRNNSELFWEPSCSLEVLQLRAQVYASIRAFFKSRCVLEVETPLLSQASGTEPTIQFFETHDQSGLKQHRLFLQTSPEFAMKRLLAASSGSIFQLAKAFRKGEVGRFHNPEFTLLEWYRIGFDLDALMDETADLLVILLPSLANQKARKLPYKTLFKDAVGVDPLSASVTDFSAAADRFELPDAKSICGQDRSTWLDFLFSCVVQPVLVNTPLVMVYDYPACQASLARLKRDDKTVCERFEVFVKGIELGNGFFELSDPVEQSRRFNREIAHRQHGGLPAAVKDQRLIAALEKGLPHCSGIAIGMDRLLMLRAGVDDISEVLSFGFGRA
ncbi:MAG: EF-P lysine aminoacylase EpmA [Methylococcaceae bacterium]|jgi:elongation factor P--(R)-beta-lysine ligase|nr:EF-P lysine aminoacylase EpmA [Methylococcaceae bacterium]